MCGFRTGKGSPRRRPKYRRPDIESGPGRVRRPKCWTDRRGRDKDLTQARKRDCWSGKYLPMITAIGTVSRILRLRSLRDIAGPPSAELVGASSKHPFPPSCTAIYTSGIAHSWLCCWTGKRRCLGVRSPFSRDDPASRLSSDSFRSRPLFAPRSPGTPGVCTTHEPSLDPDCSCLFLSGRPVFPDSHEPRRGRDLLCPARVLEGGDCGPIAGCGERSGGCRRESKRTSFLRERSSRARRPGPWVPTEQVPRLLLLDPLFLCP